MRNACIAGKHAANPPSARPGRGHHSPDHALKRFHTDSQTAPATTTLVLGLGNDIMGDDAVGLIAARRVAELFPAGPDVVEATTGGFALLELLSGYEQVLILDAMRTGTRPPGTVVPLRMKDLSDSSPTAPHCISLPDVSRLARELNIPFPSDVRALGLEIADLSIITESLSVTAMDSIPRLVELACSVLRGWGFTPANVPDTRMVCVE